MDNQSEYPLVSQFQHISSNPNVVYYLTLIKTGLELRTTLEREQTERIAIEKNAENFSKKLEIFENQLKTDANDLRVFVADSMIAVKMLISDKQYELAAEFQKQVANNLQGRVNYIAEAFSKLNNLGE